MINGFMIYFIDKYNFTVDNERAEKIVVQSPGNRQDISQ